VLAKSQGYLSLAIRIFKIPQALLTLAMRILYMHMAARIKSA